MIAEHSDTSFSGSFAEFLPPAREGLRNRIERALTLYPANIYFVHRDAERAGLAIRKQEIISAVPPGIPPHVALVPVRMTEAWLLSSETAIRGAADYPNGGMVLNLLNANRWDKEANPKRILLDALRIASGLSGRKLRKFDPNTRRVRVAELTEDFAPLRRLAAFRELERDLEHALAALAL